MKRAKKKADRASTCLPLLEPLEGRLLLSTWYVRPWGGSYDTENGTSYASAWDGFEKVVFGPGGVQAGDTLYVCGTHPNVTDTISPGNPMNNRDTILNVLASGTSESARITIRGDYAGDAGRIIRVTNQIVFDKANPAAGGWSGPDSRGVYTRGPMYSGLTNPLETDLATGNIVQLKCATATPSADPSQWVGEGIAAILSSTYYYKPRALTTRSLVYTNGVSTAVSIVGQDYITVKNLQLYGGTSSRGLVYLSDGSDHVLLDGLTIKYSGYIGIMIDRKTADGLSNTGAPCNYGEIKNCYLSRFTTGIYFISPPQRHTGWWVHHNTLENGYQLGEMGVGDYHGIMLEGGNGHVVEYNVIRHVSTAGLGVDIKDSTPMSNVIIRYNWVEDVSSNPPRLDNMALGASGSAFYPDVKVNNQLYGNVFIGGANQGIHGSIFQRQSSPSVGKAWVASNNLLLGNGYLPPPDGTYIPCTFYFGEATYPDGERLAAFTFQNNILADSGAYHIYGRSLHGMDAQHAIDYNLYDANGYHKWYAGYYGSPATDHYYDTLAAWRAGQGKDLHSSIGDALFVNEAARDLHLQWNSPAIDAGNQWWVATDIRDYYGNLIDMTDFDGRPIYGTPDIGPFEYQPPYTMGVDALPISGHVRVYGDGKYRYVNTPGATTANLSVTPSGGWGSFTATQQRPFWMDLTMTDWSMAGQYYRRWVENSSVLTGTGTTHVMGGLAGNQRYFVLVNGAISSGVTGSGIDGDGLCTSDAQGFITFTYTGSYSNTAFEVRLAMPGDSNGDGVVDAADYAAWFNHYGLDGKLADGDFDGSGIVDAGDYAIWFNNYGTGGGAAPSAPAVDSAPGASSDVVAVPTAAAASGMVMTGPQLAGPIPTGAAAKPSYNFGRLAAVVGVESPRDGSRSAVRPLIGRRLSALADAGQEPVDLLSLLASPLKAVL